MQPTQSMITDNYIDHKYFYPFYNNQFNQTKQIPYKRVQKFKFSKEEDKKLIFLVDQYGENEWNCISKAMGNRNPRQCRDRWNNYLNPMLNRDEWSFDEDILLVKKFLEIGPHWKKISLSFKHRTTNSIRNRLLKIINGAKLNKKKKVDSKNLESSQTKSDVLIEIEKLNKQVSSFSHKIIGTTAVNSNNDPELKSDQRFEQIFDIFLNDDDNDDFNCLFSC